MMPIPIAIISNPIPLKKLPKETKPKRKIPIPTKRVTVPPFLLSTGFFLPSNC